MADIVSLASAIGAFILKDISEQELRNLQVFLQILSAQISAKKLEFSVQNAR